MPPEVEPISLSSKNVLIFEKVGLRAQYKQKKLCNSEEMESVLCFYTWNWFWPVRTTLSVQGYRKLFYDGGGRSCGLSKIVDHHGWPTAVK